MEDSLRRIKWMLSKEIDGDAKRSIKTTNADLVRLNTNRLILDSVGGQLLSEIVGDYIDLLETYSAVYEENGDYALSVFSSGWCRFMNQASRNLCGTDDPGEALASGRWLCHESCWTQGAKAAIEKGIPIDIKCKGGINLYATPIRAGNDVIGAINFSYGDPPRDSQNIQTLSEQFQVSQEELTKLALGYESRPPYIIELAKKRLRVSAHIIGKLVEHKRIQDKNKTYYRQLNSLWKLAQMTEASHKQLCDLILAEIQDLTNSQYSFFGFLNEDEKTLIIHSWSKEAMDGCSVGDNPVHFPVDKAGLWSQSIIDRKSLIVNDYNKEHTRKRGLPDGHVPIKSLLCVPVLRKNKVVAIATVANKDAPYTDEDEKNIYAFVSSVLLLLEKKSSDEALRTSEQKARAILDTSFQFLGMLSVDGTLIDVNQTALDLDGLPRSEVLNRPLWEAPSWSYSTELQDRLRAAVKTAAAGETVRFEVTHPRPNGQLEYVDFSLRPVKDGAGNALFLIPEGQIITERRLAVQALKESEQKLLAMSKAIHDGLIMIDHQANVMFWNRAAEDIFGYTDKEIMGKSFHAILLPEKYRDQALKGLESFQRTGQGPVIGNLTEIEALHKNGTVFPVEVGVSAFNMNGKWYAVATVRDITKRQQAEEELRKTKELAEMEQAKWLTILDHVSSGVAAFDVSTNQIYANKKHAAIYNLDEEQGKYLTREFIREIFVMETYPDRRDMKSDEWPVHRVLAGEYLDGEIICVKRQDIEFERFMMFSGVPIYNAQNEVELAVIVSHDITEQLERERQNKLIQESMEQTQRLESLGVLAGGIAHEFNNLLMAILGNVDVAMNRLPQPSPVTKQMEIIKTASIRAADLCTQLLAYSGKGQIEEKSFSMSQLVREMVPLLKTVISKTCVLELNLDEHLPLTIGDSFQMRQVIMNFVINASEAIGNGNGIIMISTSGMNYVPECSTNDYMIKPKQPGHYVTLEVSDNGPGMDKETLGRIFEPFFTSKFTGRGLGLSAVLGIIRSQSGGLSVDSRPGVGTTFKVLLSSSRSSEEYVADVTERRQTEKKHFIGKVLLVDDDEIVRKVCSSQLKMLGLEVMTASDGQESVEIYREKQREIDLVILDLTLPKMSGQETLRTLLQLDPEMKVVIASDYAQGEVSTAFTVEKPSGYLRKPYTIKELSHVFTGLLTESR